MIVLKSYLLLQLLIVAIVSLLSIDAVNVKIGALFDYNVNDTIQMFRYAIRAYGVESVAASSITGGGGDGDFNDDNSQLGDYRRYEDATSNQRRGSNRSVRIQLEGSTAAISYGNEFQASKRVCKFLRNGVSAIFGPMSASASMHCTNICDAKEIPYVDFRWDAETKPPVINMMPHPDALAQLFVAMVRAWNWKGFTILYESAAWLPRSAALLKLYDSKEYTITVRRINSGLTDNNYRSVLRRVRLSEDVHIVLECSVDTLPEVLKQAQQVGLLTDQHQFIITSLDMHTIDLEPFQYSGANITGIRMVSPDNPVVARVTQALAADMAAEALDGATEGDAYRRQRRPTENDDDGDDEADHADAGQLVELPPGLTSDKMRTQTALVYDAVLLLTESLKQLSVDQIRMKRLNCMTMESWENGNSITNFMRNTIVHGLTGEVKFDNGGLRKQFTVDIVELTPFGLQTVGQWNSSVGLNMTRSSEYDTATVETMRSDDEFSLRNKTFRVITALSPPYGMLKELSQQLTGNDRFEGFGIDLIHELSLVLGFNYTFTLQHDGKYGSLNNVTGEWDGMIRELHDHKADLAITDLTITSERESGVDFTSPFMNLGISILYRKPTKQPPSTFTFMSPFSTEVWIYLGCAYLGVSLCLFVLGRISPTEWDNPYPCIEEPTVLENQFSLRNALWFTIGALLQQGTEIAPKAMSTRIVASIWWFFTLIIVSSYTANLAAFLTVETLTSVLSNAEQLKDCYDKPKECPVQFGAKKGGSTLNFFKEAEHGTYKNMFSYMSEHPEYLTVSNEQGLQWTQNTSMNYAYLMESSSIEYLIERNCDVTQIGGLLDDKGYGIAMRKNSPYRSALSTGILRLQEQGKLTALKVKWWKEKKGGGACGAKGDSDGAEELGMANMNGVFLVLVFGTIFATVFGVIDCILIMCRKSKMFKVPFREEFINEFKFVALCHGNTKPVRHRKSASLESPRRSQSTNGSARQERSQHSKELKA